MKKKKIVGIVVNKMKIKKDYVRKKKKGYFTNI